MELAEAYLPSSQLDRFAANTFKLFDEDKDGMLDFGEFALATSAEETEDCRQRIVWMFDRIQDKVVQIGWPYS